MRGHLGDLSLVGYSQGQLGLLEEPIDIPGPSEVEASVDLAVELGVVDVELERLREDVLDLLGELRQVPLETKNRHGAVVAFRMTMKLE